MVLFCVDIVFYFFFVIVDKCEWLCWFVRFVFFVEVDFLLWRVCCAYLVDTYAVQVHLLLDDCG